MTSDVRADGHIDAGLRAVLDGFDAAGVGWLVLRGRAQLGAPGHDVDLLVAGADLARAEDVVFGLGGVALPRLLHPWHRMYVFGSPNAPRLALDVVTEIVYNRRLRLATGLEQGVLERRVHDGSVYVPDPTDLFWTVLMHCLLDKQAFSPRRQAELAEALPLLRQGSPGEVYFAGLCRESRTAAGTVDLVRDADWHSLAALGGELLRTAGAPAGPPSAARTSRTSRRRLHRAVLAAAYPHIWRSVGLGASPRVAAVARRAEVDVVVGEVVRRPFLCSSVVRVDPARRGRLEAALRRHGYRRVRRAWYRPVRTGLDRVVLGVPPRVVVSFSGLDGAGKTRQIDALLRALEAERRTVELLWVPFKIWPQGLIGRLPAGFRSRLGPARTSAPTGRPGAAEVPTPAPVRRGRSLVWRTVGTLAAVSGGLSLRRRAARTGADVLVLDRYRLDTIVKLQFWYPDVRAGWLARVVRLLAPAPDVEFLLRVDPEVAYARKPEQWSVEQLARQARLYDALTTGRPEVVTLAAADPPDDISEVVMSHLRRVLDGR